MGVAAETIAVSDGYPLAVTRFPAERPWASLLIAGAMGVRQDFYAHVERLHVAPEQIGAHRIGHFGYFSSTSEPTLWDESLRWLRAAAETA